MKQRTEQLPDATPRPTQLSFFNRQTNAQVIVQTKLTVGSANDAHEHEANRMADMVMRKSDANVQRNAVPLHISTQRNSVPLHGLPVVQRACAHCESEKEQTAQRKETGATMGSFAAPPSVSNAIARSGGALDGRAKTFMESRFNRSFDNVQVHTDSESAASARDISARAYTAGNHIVFGEGQYQPNTEEGRYLLAHELTHVVQQTGGAANNAIQRACVGGRWRREYDGCSLPASLAGFLGINKDNPAGGSDTHFGSTTGVNMGRPCDYHDECYQSCTSDKSICDAAMLARMLGVCTRSRASLSTKLSCYQWANAYHAGLILGGLPAFLSRKRDVCTC